MQAFTPFVMPLLIAGKKRILSDFCTGFEDSGAPIACILLFTSSGMIWTTNLLVASIASVLVYAYPPLRPKSPRLGLVLVGVGPRIPWCLHLVGAVPSGWHPFWTGILILPVRTCASYAKT